MHATFVAGTPHVIVDDSATAPPGRGGHISDRFLGRVDVYDKARPGYPTSLMAWIAQVVRPASCVAEIGAGTGLFTEPLLALGLSVAAVEPNAEMRMVLGERLAPSVDAGRLQIVDGTAEGARPCRTRGRSGCCGPGGALVHTVTRPRRVCPRPAPDGQVLLVWNDWREVVNPVNEAYGQVVRAFLTPGNENVETRVPDSRIPELLPLRRERRVFVNAVDMTRERLHMLALSASYLPGPGSPNADALRGALDVLFARYERAGRITLEYRTVAYLGR